MSMATRGHSCLPMSDYSVGNPLVICSTDIPSSSVRGDMILHHTLEMSACCWSRSKPWLCKVPACLRTISVRAYASQERMVAKSS